MERVKLTFKFNSSPKSYISHFFQPERPSYGRSKSGLSRLSMLAKSTEDLSHSVKKDKKEKDLEGHDLHDGKRTGSGLLGFKSPFKKGKYWVGYIIYDCFSSTTSVFNCYQWGSWVGSSSAFDSRFGCRSEIFCNMSPLDNDLTLVCRYSLCNSKLSISLSITRLRFEFQTYMCHILLIWLSDDEGC